MCPREERIEAWRRLAADLPRERPRTPDADRAALGLAGTRAAAAEGGGARPHRGRPQSAERAGILSMFARWRNMMKNPAEAAALNPRATRPDRPARHRRWLDLRRSRGRRRAPRATRRCLGRRLPPAWHGEPAPCCAQPGCRRDRAPALAQAGPLGLGCARQRIWPMVFARALDRACFAAPLAGRSPGRLVGPILSFQPALPVWTALAPAVLTV